MANLKRHTIELVSEVNGDEVVTVIYATPAFVSTQTTYEAMDIGEKMDKQAKYERALQDGKTVEELGEEPATNKELFDTLVDFVVKLYDKQFTKKELLAGLHGPGAFVILQQHVAFVMTGTQSEQNTEMTKKFLARKA